mgnify:CR=1 FL=1
MTKRLVKESFSPEVAEIILNGFKMILDVNESIRIVGKTCFIKKKEHLSFETTYHPLLGKNGTIRHILGASDYSFKLQPDELLAIKSQSVPLRPSTFKSDKLDLFSKVTT